ncbi:helix-turn-helix domain-containing protein, partial [Rhizobium leguminosarum]|uniref:helix-turn-helix domain-containing protein n=1 Tax=Rhizobium leguminosarum TaxID=384 RepID=UPI001FEFE89C
PMLGRSAVPPSWRQSSKRQKHRGQGASETALTLHLSENTVKVHVRNIYKKMNVRNRTEAASRFFNEHPAGEDDMSGRWRN